MTNSQSTPEAVVWVAIDIAKDWHEALIEVPGWKNRKKYRVRNTAQEFRAFADFLHSSGFPVRIGFEPTGNYHRALAYFLHSEGFHLELVSSLALARTREAMHNSWDKNDPKDAQVILHLLKAGLTQHYHDPIVHDLNDLQELSKTHHQVCSENFGHAAAQDSRVTLWPRHSRRLMSALRLETIKEVAAQVRVTLSCIEHVIEDHEHRMAHGNQSAFLSAAACQAAVLRGQVAILGATCCPGGLRQGSLESAIAGRDAPPLTLPGTFLIAWTHPGPRG